MKETIVATSYAQVTGAPTTTTPIENNSNIEGLLKEIVQQQKMLLNILITVKACGTQASATQEAAILSQPAQRNLLNYQ